MSSVVLDASALLALLNGQPGAEVVEGAMASFWASIAGAVGVDVRVVR